MELSSLSKVMSSKWQSWDLNSGSFAARSCSHNQEVLGQGWLGVYVLRRPTSGSPGLHATPFPPPYAHSHPRI